MKDILVCGHTSFVASGFQEKLSKNNISFDCFSRGEESRKDNVVKGDVFNLSNNKFLDSYEAVINFILIKDASIEENINYIKSLLAFCEAKKIKKFVHISSISVYPNNAVKIDEFSEIENDYHNKSGYGAIKTAVDNYLEKNAPKNLDVVYVRPGYIYDDVSEISKVGIVKDLGPFSLLLGSKSSSLPAIHKDKLQDALVKISSKSFPNTVFLILDKDKTKATKYHFTKRQWGKKLITVPEFPLFPAVKLLKKLKICPLSVSNKIEGLYKKTYFDSSLSEKELEMDFGSRKFAVIGSGAYGSYISNLLLEKFPQDEIHIYEVGNGQIKDEKEIGFLSKIIGAPYNALTKGRFFGFGGATTKWGGQLLTFTENDFENPSPYLKDVVDINVKHHSRVLQRFNLENKIPEEHLTDKLFTKTGIWLGYFNRNLFKFFRIHHKSQVTIHKDCRVISVVENNQHIEGFNYKIGTDLHYAKYDHYFLASGSFESGRILLNSGIIQENFLPFSDHLSQKAFKIKSGTQIGNQDFVFKVNGSSLVTKRMIGEIEGISFFVHPIYNSDFPFFQNFKKLLFGRKLSIQLVKDIIIDIPSCISFAWSMFVKKKLYVYKNEFYFQIDIENPFDSGKFSLNNQLDKFKEKGLDIDFKIDSRTEDLFSKAKDIMRDYLISQNVTFEEIQDSTQVEKYEDTYHPFGIFSNFENGNSFFTRFDNMLVTNTGVLPRAGGINSTCAVFPLIEEYFDNYLQK